ncbi:helix-turn-helix transcriptional regulator [Umezawaea sp. Da 62-37]|uniref:helix-turn-helix transcriptional regulator n=1 Tax=Umezawaea sp. Da 62-37 TaxID=3075927 RepID=UPI0028F6E150|nr:helix-turn-helix transcriptional regulator [Umezawaea sp. Da 62-37]WNV85863.1 helix-turn-helix transcriptional regulator [Umezawaea sp. Da 62-37]
MITLHTVDVAGGFLTVRASGAAAAKAALNGGASTPEHIQLLLRCPVPEGLPDAGAELRFPDCSLHVLPVGVVLLTVARARLTTGFADLKPLMFQPVPVDPALRSLFSDAVAHVLAAADALDPHGLAHHLFGLAELVLRSALRAELDRVDAVVARRREAVEYMREHLADPALGADRVAEALYISRRRLYQLFDDGQGVSERIRGLRIDRAKALLADPTAAARGIGEIARDCGFVSAAHFSRTFRQVVGRTPTEFRGR